MVRPAAGPGLLHSWPFITRRPPLTWRVLNPQCLGRIGGHDDVVSGAMDEAYGALFLAAARRSPLDGLRLCVLELA